MAIKLKKNESFYIREGWFEKAINTINDEQKNIFFKNDGVMYLGIGANMVKGLKYWLGAADVISGKENELTDFGKNLIKFDPYLDNKFSWFLIHYFLVTNKEECPIFNMVFNAEATSFRKHDMTEYVYQQMTLMDPKVNHKSVEADMNVFLKSYVNEIPILNPEENYVCPLSSLKLLKSDASIYRKLAPAYNTLSYLVVYYALTEMTSKDSFNIEDSIEAVNSPMHIFNLDKYMYLQYLDEMRKNNLVTINKTAGLNTVYFEKRLSLDELFKSYFGR